MYIVRLIRLAPALMLAVSAISGCATYSSLSTAEPRSPLVYSGLRLDIDAVQNDEYGLSRFNTAPPALPWLDLPASLACDTLLLSYTIPAAAYYAIVE